jgi:hypothetical protein
VSCIHCEIFDIRDENTQLGVLTDMGVSKNNIYSFLLQSTSEEHSGGVHKYEGSCALPVGGLFG